MLIVLLYIWYINSSPPGLNGRHFADDVFRCIFVNEKFWIWLKFHWSLLFEGPIDRNQALVQIMAWRRIGDKPLCEPMPIRSTDAYMRRLGEMSLGPFWVNPTRRNISILFCASCQSWNKFLKVAFAVGALYQILVRGDVLEWHLK